MTFHTGREGAAPDCADEGLRARGPAWEAFLRLPRCSRARRERRKCSLTSVPLTRGTAVTSKESSSWFVVSCRDVARSVACRAAYCAEDPSAFSGLWRMCQGSPAAAPADLVFATPIRTTAPMELVVTAPIDSSGYKYAIRNIVRRSYVVLVPVLSSRLRAWSASGSCN